MTFPGPSSNIAFLRHISLALAQASGYTQAIETTPSPSRAIADRTRVTRPHYVHGEVNENTFNRSEGKINIYTLPPEARIWQLIKEYFQKTGQLLPFIHEESFCETYFQLKRTNFTMARRTWLGLLNMILAMACTLTVDGYASAEERIDESDVYYQRANGLCEREVRKNISLELGESLSAPSRDRGGTVTYPGTNLLTRRCSAIPTPCRPISPRNAEIRSSMDYPWPSHYGRDSVGLAFSAHEPGLPTVRM